MACHQKTKQIDPVKKLLTVTTFLIFSVKIFSQNIGAGTATTTFISIVNALPDSSITHTFGPLTMDTYLVNMNLQFDTKTNRSFQFLTNNGNAQITIHKMEIPALVHCCQRKNWM